MTSSETGTPSPGPARPRRRRRRRRRSILGRAVAWSLVVLALVAPAVGAVVVRQRATASVEAAEQRVLDEFAATVGIDRADDGADARPEATAPTPLASWRRLPDPLAERAAWAAYVEVAQAALGEFDDGWCVDVSVDGRRVVEHRARQPMVPASNQKLLVAAAVLDRLGVDHRFVTEIRAAAPVDGVITGDLHLVGGGDPLLASADVPDPRRYPAFATTSMDALADAVVAAGVRVVDGDVIGDGSRYDDEFVVPSWGPGITRGDGGPVDALLVNDGTIFGSGVGLDPNQSAANELNRLLVARGVTITGRNRTGVTPEGTPVLASVTSAPLSEVVAELLQTSDNNTAEMLVKELGYAATGLGTRAAGLQVVRDVLGEWGVPLDGLVLDDGSGLSRENRTTCATLLAVLDRAESELGSTALADALAVAATSGTLVDQFQGTGLEGIMRAKTGTLSDVKALSGEVTAEDGSVLRFASVAGFPGADDPEAHLPRWSDLAALLLAYPVDVEPDAFAPR
jgi:serine-type D-Ala-D-Ala carboxypeptidase/endopeptidase (penicillin-binding protein 4)